MSELTSMAYLLLSVQRAMLDEVTPDLRGVAVATDGERVQCRFLFESAINAEIRDRVSEIEAEVVADFGLTPVSCVAEFAPIEKLRSLQGAERWAYLRHEQRA